ncbi:hypothetical protein A3B05_01100 [Candidatus Giovannonibacteria bacterium RIFCSPLOWO2_01_FULL_43_160]|uniref:UDP-glucose 6-dehydrogenase n=2 Tax=Candidatus Giovannoniibacteriota TaxID=1752738 RepID=A0A0G1IWH4_9BACT|nr:MAG: UDP-glucose 6-dehydrogenase [Candidatus Giovannonibacteria bacterium GW2011_GWB1_43_13]KKS99646.1 MAG: UDP-glucose 6-dehydrogenase [Candidatus Giovannonibacteria bacterium GW2011_GWA1_43_15]KKT21488.1 MAG: UDP-glucose 6-dehydrogenase [Candidatus Giovannonibacteria bacterium GW2011_GWC2_43_8]KKT63731.1 MAG: UDP-glucose 6-dehydrogenase [Candidatus Giovannonibacteria bacterium GW2011_GWA2_44_26]OGF58298.1 MAG: hypothetical protein A2652_00405 [Candidatus Giovannonibacteria bacterium RIFCSP
MKKYKIGVVGLWHLGEIYSAGLSDLGHDIIGFDENSEIVSNLNKGIPPLAEPKLAKIIKKNIKNGRLFFNNAFEQLKTRDIIWLTFDTPVDDKDNVNLKPVWNFLKSNAKFFKNNILIIISSQMPVGTCSEIEKLLARLRPKLNFNLAYAPENLQLGRALKSFFEPDRIVIGASSREVIQKIESVFSGIKTNFIPMSVASAEMSKHALNAFLATSIGFIDDISDLSRAYGADAVDVAKSLRSDKRIGSYARLDAGIGFSGGTLARDLKILIKKGSEVGIKVPLISTVFKRNNLRRNLVVEYLKKYFAALRLRGKKIAVLGLTYKPGTPTLRRAMSLEIIKKLKKAGAVVSTCDPLADEKEAEHLTGAKFYKNPYLALKGANAAVFINNSPEFKKINFKKMKALMKKPFIFFDTGNYFYEREKEIKKRGFLYTGIGR